MNRMWEIREHDNSRYGHRMGMRDKSIDDAYECGYEDGYEAAMEEVEGSDKFNMRSRSGSRYSSRRM